jgi:hypothetical protein
MSQAGVDHKSEFEKGRQLLNNVRTDEEAIEKVLREFIEAITKTPFKVIPVHGTASNDRTCEIVHSSYVLLRVCGMVAKYEHANPYGSSATIYPVKLQHPSSGVAVKVDDLKDLKSKLGYFARHPRFVADVLAVNGEMR